MRLLCLGLALLVFAEPACAAGHDSSQLGLHLRRCTEGKDRVPALCGWFGVYENRAARAGRIISLHVVVLKARRETRHAIAWLQGGPGAGSAMDAPIIAEGGFNKEMAALRDRYDIVMLDNRGAGLSNPTGCNTAPARDPQSYFAQLWPDKILKACAAAYARHADRSLYNTNNAEDDLDDLRAALGYPKLVLDGGSYGTFDALIYMRRHPSRVESAVLNSIAAPHFMPLPGEPEGAQTALTDLVAKCSLDRLCHSRFPRFATEFHWLLHRFDRGPMAVVVKNRHLTRAQTVRLSKEVFVDQLRHALYTIETSAVVPYVVDAAYSRNTLPLGMLIDGMARGFSAELDMGTNLSYTCAEEIPFITQAQIRKAAGSFASDLRVRAQQHACAIWTVPHMPESFNEPVRSNVPILIIAGSDDPATPPRYAYEALRYLPRAKIMLVRGAGHGVETPCTDRVIEQFIRTRTTQGLNISSCAATARHVPFTTSMKDWMNF